MGNHSSVGHGSSRVGVTLAALAVVWALPVAAASAVPMGDPAPPVAPAATIEIGPDGITPAEVAAVAGDRLAVENTTADRHVLVPEGAQPGCGDEGVVCLDPGERTTITVDRPGTYRFRSASVAPDQQAAFTVVLRVSAGAATPEPPSTPGTDPGATTTASTPTTSDGSTTTDGSGTTSTTTHGSSTTSTTTDGPSTTSTTASGSSTTTTTADGSTTTTADSSTTTTADGPSATSTTTDGTSTTSTTSGGTTTTSTTSGGSSTTSTTSSGTSTTTTACRPPTTTTTTVPGGTGGTPSTSTTTGGSTTTEPGGTGGTPSTSTTAGGSTSTSTTEPGPPTTTAPRTDGTTPTTEETPSTTTTAPGSSPPDGGGTTTTTGCDRPGTPPPSGPCRPTTTTNPATSTSRPEARDDDAPCPTTTTTTTSTTTTSSTTTTTTAPEGSTGGPSVPGPPPPPPAVDTPAPPHRPAPGGGPRGGSRGPGATSWFTRGFPPELRALSESVERTAPRSTAPLAEAVAELEAAGIDHDQAVREVFGRFPVGGLAHYGHDWLYPRYGPGWRLHQGTDVFAERGTPVRAPAAGVVSTTNGGLGGLSVRVTQADGTYWYLAHLSALVEGFTQGATVAVGDVVGYVGNSGNAQGTPPHLHIEHHPEGGPAVDSKPSLDRFLDEAVAALPDVMSRLLGDEAEAPSADLDGARFAEAVPEVEPYPLAPRRPVFDWDDPAVAAGAGAAHRPEVERRPAWMDAAWVRPMWPPAPTDRVDDPIVVAAGLAALGTVLGVNRPRLRTPLPPG